MSHDLCRGAPDVSRLPILMSLRGRGHPPCGQDGSGEQGRILAAYHLWVNKKMLDFHCYFHWSSRLLWAEGDRGRSVAPMWSGTEAGIEFFAAPVDKSLRVSVQGP
jgi:hypothetical protein